MSDRKVDSGELRVDGPNGADPAINYQPSTINQPHLSPNQRAWRRFKRNRPAMVGVWFLALVLVFILVYPFVSPYRAEQLSDEQFQPPSAGHWLGTDVHGRDLLVRLCYGAQISLLVGIVGASVCLVIGVSWGSIAGYAGGRLRLFSRSF
jgi:ABC-type dipeptide/oligopeptide/nickel transport system permease subunit